MAEMVLALPVILLVLALLLFLGRSMLQLQRASVMDRYETWRQVHRAPPPGAVYDPLTGRWTEEGGLNELFFDGRASSIDVSVDGDRALEADDVLVSAAQRLSSDAGAMAEAIVRRLPGMRRVRLVTTVPPATSFDQRLGGPIEHQHLRLEHEWKFANGIRHDDELDRWVPTDPRQGLQWALRDAFLSDLDERLAPLSDNGNIVAGQMRGHYLWLPPYRGPDIPDDW